MVRNHTIWMEHKCKTNTESNSHKHNVWYIPTPSRTYITQAVDHIINILVYPTPSSSLYTNSNKQTTTTSNLIYYKFYKTTMQIIFLTRATKFNITVYTLYKFQVCKVKISESYSANFLQQTSPSLTQKMALISPQY